MFDGLKTLLDSFNFFDVGEPEADGSAERLAVACLLVHAATVDGHMDDAEDARLRDLLTAHYRLDDSQCGSLIDQAKKRDKDAVEIFGFTRVIQKTLSQEDRQSIIRLMWQIAAADGVIHEFESNLIWRTAELIGVSSRDRIHLRQDVLAQTGLSGSPGND